MTKEALRNEARLRRTALARGYPDHAARLAEHAAELGIAAESVVGAYVAKADEADPSLLLMRLSQMGCPIAVPRVVAKNAPLAFHHWEPGRALWPGAFGIPEPNPDWPIAVPDVILVPLLAFDAEGYRLGYGGGFYDRTLAALGPGKTVIGVAYAGQEVPQLPHEAHDHPLDRLVSELGVRRFR